MRTKDEVLEQCLGLPGTCIDQPFRDENWTVARHLGNRKIFAWVFEREGCTWVNVKCDPDWRDALRQRFAAVVPAYHLNKAHWNSVILDGTVPDEDVCSMIAESYELTKPKLPRASRSAAGA